MSARQDDRGDDTAPTSPAAEQIDADSERIVAAGHLLAGVSHESRNILTAILAFAQVGQRRQHDPTKMAEILKLIEAETQRCIDLHATLLAQVAATAPTSRSEPPTSTQLAEVMSSASRLVRPQMGMRRVKLEAIGVDQGIIVSCDGSSLGQVFLNLLINALQAVPEGGLVRMSATTDPALGAVIVIEDSGPGVPAEDRAQIFERMFTTKSTGTGIGLAVSLEIVRALGGSIDVDDSILGGARFSVTIPLSTAAREDA